MMQRYGRYWDEDERGRGYERGSREGRREGERGGWLGGRDQYEPRDRSRDWRETDPYYGGHREEGWGERHGSYGRGGRGYYDRGYYDRGPTGDYRRMPRSWGERGERSQYGEGRGPMYGYGLQRDREQEDAHWEPRRERREEEPGLMERIGEGIRSFFAGGEERGPHAGKGPKGYRRSDDRIREDVCDRIASWGWVDASDVEVRVQEGEVTLSGQVGARRDKRLLEEMIEGVSGVIDVHNQIRVRREVGQRPLVEASRAGSRPA